MTKTYYGLTITDDLIKNPEAFRRACEVKRANDTIERYDERVAAAKREYDEMIAAAKKEYNKRIAKAERRLKENMSFIENDMARAKAVLAPN